MDNKNKSIVYVNFPPYENAGKMLDFLISNFKNVFLFSFEHQNLSKNPDANMLKIYHQGKLIDKRKLLQLPVPKSMVFLLLPIRSLYILLQVIWYCYLLRKKIGTLDIYFTVNAFTAWVGIILKKIGLVKRTIFWVWDYYPPKNESKVVVIMRWIYWQFDKIGIHSDRVVFLNKRLQTLREDMGILPRKKYLVVPIGTDIKKVPPKKSKTISLIFVGVLKKSQGLDIVLDNQQQIAKQFPNAKLEIVGGGPDVEYFQNKAKDSLLPINFHGLVDENKLDKLLKKADIGFAPYKPDKTNLSYYSDPSKIKIYLSYGLAVITTNATFFSKEISHSKSGVIINYNQPSELTKAIHKIITQKKLYNKNALNLAKKYNYLDIYPEIFKI